MNSGGNRAEKAYGIDLNGDGFIGGEGLKSKLERVTHVDLNGDGIIGRLPDTISGSDFPPNNYGGFPPTNNYGPGF